MWRLINKGSNNHHYQNQKHHYTRDDTWWAAVTQWRCVPRKASLRARQIQLQTLQTSWQLLDEFLQTFLWDFTVGKVQLHLRPALATPISNLGGKTMIRLICQFLPKCSTKLHRNYILQFSATLPVATLRCKASKGDVKCGLKAHPAFKRSQDVWLLSSQVSQGQKKTNAASGCQLLCLRSNRSTQLLCFANCSGSCQSSSTASSCEWFLADKSIVCPCFSERFYTCYQSQEAPV